MLNMIFLIFNQRSNSVKKSLILTSFAVLGMQLHAKSPADEFMLFNTMESSHKSDWFDHMKKVHNAKYDLLKAQHKEWTSYINKSLSDWQNNADCSQPGKDKIFTEELRKAIKLHKKQNDQFKKLCKDLHDDAIKIQKHHEKELNEFIKKYMPSEQAPAQEAMTKMSPEKSEMMGMVNTLSPEDFSEEQIMTALEERASKLPPAEKEKFLADFWAEVEKEKKKLEAEQKK